MKQLWLFFPSLIFFLIALKIFIFPSGGWIDIVGGIYMVLGIFQAILAGITAYLLRNHPRKTYEYIILAIGIGFLSGVLIIALARLG